MSDAPRSNRPAPRTPAAVEAELRRRVRLELEQARGEADGQLEDAALAGIIARAVSAALQWHLEAPEHTRNATLSSRTWRPAGGPRGGRAEDEDDRPPRGRDFPRAPRESDGGPRPPRNYDRGPRQFDRGPRPPRDFDRGPRDYDRGPRDYDGGPRRYDNGPRDYDRPSREDYQGEGADYEGGRGPRGFDRDRPRPPRQGGRPPYPRGGGGGFKRGGGFKGGGFRPRRPK